MHRRAAEERIAAHAEAGSEFDFADHGFSIRHQCQCPVQAFHLGTGDVDSIELTLERAGVGGEFHGDVGAAHARAWRGRLQLRHVEAEIAEHAAHPAHPRFHIVFDRAQRRDLAALDLIERSLQADDPLSTPWILANLFGCGLLFSGARGFPVALRDPEGPRNHGIADRGGFGCARRKRVRCGGSARRRLDRSGDLHVRQRAQRRGARFSVVCRRMTCSSFWSNCS